MSFLAHFGFGNELSHIHHILSDGIITEPE
nr:MAG TPA: hypothetical protein [Caudoviricetes sp.]